MRILLRRLASHLLPLSTIVGAAAFATLLAGCEDLLVRDPGEKLWRKHCADCHGLDGAGNTVRAMGEPYADLRDNSWRNGVSDKYSLEMAIREGVFAKMPANDKLTDEEVKLVLRHLYKLRGESPQ